MARIRTIKPGFFASEDVSAPRYRKAAIPAAVRREVAQRYGCPPGGKCEAACHYCGVPAHIWWPARSDGRPGGWVHFGHELDHVHPEFHGGLATADNIVLACRPCNRRKGARVS